MRDLFNIAYIYSYNTYILKQIKCRMHNYFVDFSLNIPELLWTKLIFFRYIGIYSSQIFYVLRCILLNMYFMHNL